MAFNERGLLFVDCSIRIATVACFQSHSTNTIRIPTQDRLILRGLPTRLHWTIDTTLALLLLHSFFRRFTPHYAELAYAP
jgi:hypothetical protein